jgi:signal transduction histidine kinase
MRRNGRAIITLLLVLAQAAEGQPRALNWRLFGTNDGMPANACVSVTTGRRGKIWANQGADGRVSTLDGYSVTSIEPSPNAVRGKVYESPTGELWLACADGLEEYRDQKWTHHAVPELAQASGRSGTNRAESIPLCPIRPSRVLFLLPDALMQLDIEDPLKHHASVLLKASQTPLEGFTGMIRSMRDETVWISGRHGLAHAGPGRALNVQTEWKEYIPPEGIENLREPVEDADGGITMVADSETNGQKVVVHFDGQQWEQHPVEDENIRFAWRGPNGIFWAATADSLFRLDPNSGFVPEDEYAAHEYFDVCVEAGGNFWLATSDGLLRYSPPVWQAPMELRGFNSPVTAMTKDADGWLWAASPTALHAWHEHQWTSHPIPEEIRQQFPGARQIYALADGNIVLAAETLLIEFNRQTGQFEKIAAPQKIQLRALGLLSDATLCVQELNLNPGNHAPQLEIFDGSTFKSFPFAPPPTNLGNELLLLSTSAGNLWLAGSKGVAHFRDQKWQTCGPRGPGTNDSPLCVAEIGDDRIWCGFTDEIDECDGKSWRPIRGALGRVNDILLGRDGSIWVAASTGAHRFQEGNWLENNIAEGLPGSAVNGILEDNSGRIWAGTSGGLGIYHPEADPDPPQTTISSPTNTDDNFPEGSSVTITFAAVDKWKFSPASRLLYSYRLDTNDWSPYQEGGSVTLPELPAVEHYFRVRSMDRNWNQDPNPALFEFAVVLPWYKESRLLLISSAGMVIILFFAGVAVNRHLQLRRSHAQIEAQVALRTKQLQRANQELLHSQKMNALGTLAAGIAHDFNSILSIIKGSAQIIEDNLDNPEKIKTRADRINTVVEQGAGIVKAMLGFSRGSGGEKVMCNINALVGETVKLLGDRFLREVEVRFEPARSIPEVPASPDFIQQIMLNLIFNAAEAMTDHRQILVEAKHGAQLPASMVLTPAAADDYVFIAVKDSGCGISPEILPRIFEPFFTTKSLSARRGTGLGLSMVYELARQMEAGLAVQSTLNEGSVFTLILPVRELPVDEKAEPN